MTKQKQDVYVITGRYLQEKLKTIGNGVIVPTAVYKAVYMPKTGAIGAYYAPNDNSLKVRIVSVCYLEEQLGINLFPQLTEEQKRNTYRLPLTAKAVKPTRKLNIRTGMRKASVPKTFPKKACRRCNASSNLPQAARPHLQLAVRWIAQRKILS